jgi:OOP family OmpA-OmpF porin
VQFAAIVKHQFKKMKNIFVLIIACLLAFLPMQKSIAQGLLKEFGGRLKNRAKEKVIQKAEQKTDKSIEEVTQGNKNESKDAGKTTTENTDSKVLVTENKENGTDYKSKFDFAPGEKILMYEDFSADAVGDFPARWNTTAAGEVVTIEGESGKWLMISKDGVYMPILVTALPENFTFQFDLIANKGFSSYSAALDMLFASLVTKKEFYSIPKYRSQLKDVVSVWFHPANSASTAGTTGFMLTEKGAKISDNKVSTNQFFAGKQKAVAKISVWRQKERLRVYINEEKIWDLPQGFNQQTNYNSLVFMLKASHFVDDKYFMSNLRFAVGEPDTRNKLLTEGKFSTNGILFDVNSDIIKPESYGVLKEIATVLKENPQLKIKIVGHTDSDGEERTNLELSKKRAAAVKTLLGKDFGINDTSMETDGKGEVSPIDNNNSLQGKANNRRVEFIKL